jgi:glycosyltransferase involved in cell wall biosynthesis
MDPFRPRVLVLSLPVGPPWSRGDRNLVHTLAAHLRRYRACLLTHEGVRLGLPEVETLPVWGARGQQVTAPRRLAEVIRSLIARGDVALVHLIWPADRVFSPLVAAACRLRGLPLVHTLTRPPRFGLGQASLLAARSRPGGKGAPATLVALHAGTRARLERRGIADVAVMGPPVVMRPGLAGAEKTAVRRRFGIPQGARLVCYAGDWRDRDAARTVAAAVPRIRREHDVHFVFACRVRDREEGSEQRRIEAALTADGLAGHVTFLEEAGDLRDLLAVSSVHALPLTAPWDKLDLPLAAIEGLAEGCATVATRAGGLADLVEAGAAIGIPLRDAASLAVVVGELLRHDQRRQAQAETGRQLARTRFAAEVVAGQYEALYDELLGRRRTDGG